MRGSIIGVCEMTDVQLLNFDLCTPLGSVPEGAAWFDRAWQHHTPLSGYWMPTFLHGCRVGMDAPPIADPVSRTRSPSMSRSWCRSDEDSQPPVWCPPQMASTPIQHHETFQQVPLLHTRIYRGCANISYYQSPLRGGLCKSGWVIP